MPIIIRPDGDTDLANATIHAETTLPQTIGGLTAGTYEVGRVEWSPTAVTVTAPDTAPVITITSAPSALVDGNTVLASQVTYTIDTPAIPDDAIYTRGITVNAGAFQSLEGGGIVVTEGQAIRHAVRVQHTATATDTTLTSSPFTVLAASGTTPATILGADIVEWFDPQNTANLFNTSAGTGSVAADGTAVGRIVGGEGGTFSAVADNTTRPIYRTANGGYLEGSDASATYLTGSLSRSGATYLAMRCRLRAVESDVARQLLLLHNNAGANWWMGNYFSMDYANYGIILLSMAGGAAVTPTTATWFTFEAVAATDQRDTSLNGGAWQVNGDAYSTVSTTLLSMFGDPEGNSTDLDIGRIVLGSAVPTAQQRTDIRAWLEA